MFVLVFVSIFSCFARIFLCGKIRKKKQFQSSSLLSAFVALCFVARINYNTNEAS